MAITLKCACGEVMTVSEEHAGKVGKCPHCGRPNKIPTLDEIDEFRKKSGRLKKEEIEEKKESSEKKKRPSGSKFKTPSKKTGMTRKGKTGRYPSKRRDRDDDDSNYPKRKKNLLVPAVIILVLLIVGGIAALVLLSSPDIDAAKDLYKGYIKATDSICVPLGKYCDKYIEKEPAYATFSEDAGVIENLWSKFDDKCAEEFQDAPDTHIYTLIRNAKDIFLREAMNHVGEIDSSQYRDPVKRDTKIALIRKHLKRIKRHLDVIKQIGEKRQKEIGKGKHIL